MLISYNDVARFAIEAVDGRKGNARDFYFDDEGWRIRYLVAESGFLFTSRESLIGADNLGAPDLAQRALPVTLTKTQLEEAETPDAHPPVSEQRERAAERVRPDLWPPVILGVPGAAYTPAIAEEHLFGPPEEDPDMAPAPEETGDPHLRSMAEVTGYAVEATDGEIGAITDFLVDPETWAVRYLVADTGTWLPDKQVAIRPSWIADIRWADRTIAVDTTQKAVKGAPEITDIDELARSDSDLAMAYYGAYAGLPI